MDNISHLLDEIYIPKKILAIYRSSKKEENIFVEAYDLDRKGNPINAHPLSMDESANLANLFESCTDLKRDFMKSKGLLPEKVLYLNPQLSGYVVWYTPPQEVPLYFTESLGIPCGKGKIPAMVWKATKENLYVYAAVLPRKKRLTEDSALYHAPFFNVRKEGSVCMGTVNIDIDGQSSLEDFMDTWESYFWNSYFSHLMESFCPVSVNIVQLWKGQVGSGKPFDVKTLIKNGRTISDIL